MSRCRMAMVNILIVALVLGHLHAMRTRSIHWPFSPYEMFARLGGDTGCTFMTIKGVTADGREIRLSGPDYSAPLPSFHVRLALQRALDICDPVQRQRKLHALTAEYLRRYEQRRRAGLLDGADTMPGNPALRSTSEPASGVEASDLQPMSGAPALVGMRIYEEVWPVMDPWARDAGRPKQTRLLFDSRQSAPPSAGPTTLPAGPSINEKGDL